MQKNHKIKNTFSPKIALNKKQVDNALLQMEEWFPEHKKSIQLYRTEVTGHMLNGTRPAPDSALGKLTIAGAREKGWEDDEIDEGLEISDCTSAIIGVGIAGGFLVMSMVGVPCRLSESLERQIARTITAEVEYGFRRLVKEINTAAGAWDKSMAFFKLMAGLYKIGGIRIFIKYAFADLEWYDWLLAGATIIAQFLIWFASDGLAFVGEVMLLILTATDLLLACTKVGKACKDAPPPKGVQTFKPAGSYLQSCQSVKVEAYVMVNGSHAKSYIITDLSVKTEFKIDGSSRFAPDEHESKNPPKTFKPLGSYGNVSKLIGVFLYAECYNYNGDKIENSIDITNEPLSLSYAVINGRLVNEKDMCDCKSKALNETPHFFESLPVSNTVSETILERYFKEVDDNKQLYERLLAANSVNNL